MIERILRTPDFATSGDDRVNLPDTNDRMYGSMGDDRIFGGGGDDWLNGGPGNDYLNGGVGDDFFLVHSYGGKPRSAQLYIGDGPLSNVAPGSIDPETGRLVGVHENGPTENNTLIVGGPGADKVALQPLMNTTEDFMRKHADACGEIDWRAVAQENTNVGDHWLDILGVNVWADYNKAEGDMLVVDGHTAKVDVEHTDINGDGDLESILTITSADMRNGAPQAHVHDWLGALIVDGDLVTQDDVIVRPMSFPNLIGNINDRGDFIEAVNPHGTPARHEVDGEIIIGYDTRYRADDPITGNIEYYFENPYINEIPGLLPSGPPPASGNAGGGDAPAPGREPLVAPEPTPEPVVAEPAPQPAPEPAPQPAPNLKPKPVPVPETVVPGAAEPDTDAPDDADMRDDTDAPGETDAPDDTDAGGHVFGTARNDTISATSADDIISALFGNDQVFGQAGDDILAGNRGRDSLYGEDGNDTLKGGRGHDMLDGGAGEDVLAGHKGGDILDGGSGDDILVGGRGKDVLSGGDGKDALTFKGKSGRDQIVDFVSGEDKIQIQGAQFESLNISQDGDDTLISIGHIAVVIEDTDASQITRGDFIF